MIIGIHNALGLSFLTPQGVFIFVLFSWATAAHVTLTLCRIDSQWSGMTGGLILLALIGTAYFYVAEHFTHFLYPDPGVVAAYFQAAALPEGVFLTFAGLFVGAIVSNWFMLYLHYHDRSLVSKSEFLAMAYMFFLNRVYMDSIALRLFDSLKSAGRVLDRSRVALPIIALTALAVAWKETARFPADLPGSVALLVLSGLCLPLFPFHGLYLAALTRAPRA